MNSEEASNSGWGKLGDAWRKIQAFISTNAGSSSSTLEYVLDEQQTRQINNNVYELYAPEDGNISMEIVFFHGLQLGECSSPHITTWMSRTEPPELWPKTWLGKSFPKARILSVCYDSSGTQGSQHGRLDLHLMAENLFLALIRLARVGQTWGCPIVMVGHCLGGLLIKQMCVHLARKEFNLASDRESAERFVDNVRGVYLFATPQQGMNFPVSVGGWLNPSPLLEGLRILDTATGRLNWDFQHYRTLNNWRIQGVGESSQTRTSANPMSFFNAVMVEEASARLNMDNFSTASAGHFDICKPVSKKDVIFQALVDFIGDLTREDVSVKTLRPVSLRLPKHGGVGLETRREEVRELLEKHNRLAIVGMGGLGKTTIAISVFNAISPRFEYTCFVENLKEELKRIPRPKLESLVMDNLWRNSRKVAPKTESAWSILEGKLVLLVLDDVDSKEQIDAVPEPGWFAIKSKVIATSRFRSEEIFQGEFYLYDSHLLNNQEARELFCSYASKSGQMREDLVKKVVEKCDGLPLTLEVIGSYLGSETREEIWNDVFVKLSSAEPVNGSADDKLWRKLRLSFDTLGPTEQAMFLDCASFFAGYDTNLSDIKASWSRNWATIEVGWKNLLDRCLVSEINFANLFSCAKKVGMHDQLRDMGRSIGCPQHPTPLVQITRVRELGNFEALQMSTKHDKGRNNVIEGLELADWKKQTHMMGLTVPSNRLAKMSKLRILRMKDVALVGNRSAFPPKLAFLTLRNSRRLWQSSVLVSEPRWIIQNVDLANLANLAALYIDEYYTIGGRLPENLGNLKELRYSIYG